MCLEHDQRWWRLFLENEPLTCASSTNDRMSADTFTGKVRHIKM